LPSVDVGGVDEQAHIGGDRGPHDGTSLLYKVKT
jgi:hypothetical protein